MTVRKSSGLGMTTPRICHPEWSEGSAKADGGTGASAQRNGGLRARWQILRRCGWLRMTCPGQTASSEPMTLSEEQSPLLQMASLLAGRSKSQWLGC